VRRNVIIRTCLAGLQLLTWSIFLVELKPFGKTFGNNSLSDNFIIICVRIVRRNREKPHFCVSNSSGLMQGAIY
jgi:hypothetical protein